MRGNKKTTLNLEKHQKNHIFNILNYVTKYNYQTKMNITTFILFYGYISFQICIQIRYKLLYKNI
ncbi:hypothetical protein CRX48_03490 [Morganella morganii]|nr:hypothetical protein AL531_03590 [Morganella morganii]PHH07644.1 hypothetical protein CRX48_03490 [Morganella morganii]RAX28152.1 hypothetical protein DQ401_05085 [Morganella morganii]RDC69941.1 hypothetical protein DVJ80_00010 [Morganella morganii]